MKSLAPYKGLYLKLNTVNDKDVIERLNKQQNKQGYIKDLIRTDIDLDIFRKGVENGSVRISADDCLYNPEGST